MKRIVAPFLAILILLSTTGLTYTTHFCMGRAVENAIMIGTHDLSCGMSEMDNDDCAFTGFLVKESNCCDNEHLAIETDAEYENVISETSINSKFLIAFTYAVLNNHVESNEPTQAYTDQHPPPLEQDFQSLYQSFLL